MPARAVAEQLMELTQGRGVDVVVDYVSATATLEAGAKALGRRGRLVTLGGGGAGKTFSLSAADLLNKEQAPRQPLRHPQPRCWNRSTGGARRGVPAGLAW